MNSQLIRDRLHGDTTPFVLRWTDGTRVPVLHPDFAAMAPGQTVVIGKSGGITRIDPLHIVAIEETSSPRRRTNGKRAR